MDRGNSFIFDTASHSLTEFQRDHPVVHLRDLQIRNAKFTPPPS
jgi:hypothetical protein